MQQSRLYSWITSERSWPEREPLTPRSRAVGPGSERYYAAQRARRSRAAYREDKHANFSHINDLGQGLYNPAFLSAPYAPTPQRGPSEYLMKWAVGIEVSPAPGSCETRPDPQEQAGDGT